MNDSMVSTEKASQMSDEIWALRRDNERLKSEIERLTARRENFCPKCGAMRDLLNAFANDFKQLVEKYPLYTHEWPK